ncbi:hypothetical protein llg_25550 [Luteolibacter sp. LG18]|nr:hypothetical protein llg_25550 [Luteolibacter sp. LG18]
MAISLQFAASIDRFHGLLTTMFPHEGLTAIGGPGKLLHGSFLRKLEEVMEDLRDVAPAEAGVTGGGGGGDSGRASPVVPAAAWIGPSR